MKNRKQTKQNLQCAEKPFPAVRIFRVLSHEMPTVQIRCRTGRWHCALSVHSRRHSPAPIPIPHPGPFNFNRIPASQLIPYHRIPSHTHHIAQSSAAFSAGASETHSSSRRSSSSASWGTYAACQSNLLTWLWFCWPTNRGQDCTTKKKKNKNKKQYNCKLLKPIAVIEIWQNTKCFSN